MILVSREKKRPLKRKTRKGRERRNRELKRRWNEQERKMLKKESE